MIDISKISVQITYYIIRTSIYECCGVIITSRDNGDITRYSQTQRDDTSEG